MSVLVKKTTTLTVPLTISQRQKLKRIMVDVHAKKKRRRSEIFILAQIRYGNKPSTPDLRKKDVIFFSFSKNKEKLCPATVSCPLLSVSLFATHFRVPPPLFLPSFSRDGFSPDSNFDTCSVPLETRVR